MITTIIHGEMFLEHGLHVSNGLLIEKPFNVKGFRL
jgi:hypothetical protein